MKLRINPYYLSITIVNVAAALMLFLVIAPFEPAAASRSTSATPTAPIQHQAKKTISGTPVRIIIPSLQLDIPVKTGSFDSKTKQWTISNDAVYFADYSVLPNDTNGTTLLYGHARWGLFGALPDLGDHADAYIYTKENITFHYQYISSNVVTPDNTSVFSRSTKPQLVLQTCSGAWSQYRTLYSFSLAAAKSE